ARTSLPSTSSLHDALPICQACVVDTQCPEAGPGERHGHPSRIEWTAGVDAATATDTVDDAGQPGPPLIRLPEAEEPVSRRECTRSEEHTSELQSRGHLVCR